MKTLCFFSGDITRSGGTEHVSCLIANGLAETGKYRILFVSLIEAAEKTFYELKDTIPHYALGRKWIQPGPGYLKVIPKLRRFLKQHDIDIMIDIDIVLDILSIPAAKGLKTKIVSWEHFNYNYEMESPYRRRILNYSVTRSDYIVTLTKNDKKAYMENLKRTKNISAIYNPIQEPVNADCTVKENWLLTVGHLIKRKGTDYLGEIAAAVLKNHPDWKWIVIGEGEERAALLDLIEKEGIREQLILTGRINDVTPYLQKAAIYVMTSRAEGLPLCLLEAKAYRLPSVSFRIPGPDEIIENDGILIKPFDCRAMAEKLDWLMKDSAARKQFSENAWNNLPKFQMKNILRHWDRVLDKLE